MHVRIIAVGKVKEKYLQEGIAEYEKRLRSYLDLQIVEITEEKRPASASVSIEKSAMEKEGGRILAAIPPGSFTIALDIKGTDWSSRKLPILSASGNLQGRAGSPLLSGGTSGLTLQSCHKAICVSRFRI